MPCISASLPKIPIPALDLLIPNFTFGIPAIGINLCCNFQLPFLPLSITIPLGAILALLGPAVDAVMLVITSAINVINSYLDVLRFSFSCPLD